MKMSSIPIRACRNSTPSQITRIPATAPRNVDRVNRLAARITSTTMIVPASAELKRQPQPS